MQEKLKQELEQKYLESTRNNNNNNNKEMLTYECEVQLLDSTHRSRNKEKNKRNDKSKENRSF